MVEYNFNPSSASAMQLGRYGKIVRIRYSFVCTAAAGDGNNVVISIRYKSGSMPFYNIHTFRIGAAGSYIEDINRSFDVNIDIDADTELYYSGSVAGTMRVWLDIVSTKTAQKRQFHDKLSGINSYET